MFESLTLAFGNRNILVQHVNTVGSLAPLMNYAVAHVSDLYTEYNMGKTILELSWYYKGNQPGLNSTTYDSSCSPKNDFCIFN